MNAIQQNLLKLNGEPGWVVIYGMAGCGKSVLAAESVRDHFFLDGKFDYHVLVSKEIFFRHDTSFLLLL